MFGSSGWQLLFHPRLPHLALSYSSREAAKLSKFDFTSHAPQQLQIFTRSPYITIMLQNIQKQTEKKTQNLSFLIRAGWSCWYTALYEITETPTTTTTTKRFDPSFIIILNKIK